MNETEVVGYAKSVLIENSSEIKYERAIFKLHRLISVDFYNLTALIQTLGAGTYAVKPINGIYFSYYGTIKIRINKIYYHQRERLPSFG